MATKTDTKPETQASAASASGPAYAAPPRAGNEPEPPISLEHFCVELSQTDRRVELIGGFHYSEKAAGRLRDTPSAYRARYQSFTTRPA